MHLVQQVEPFPGKPGGERLTGWLSAQHLLARFSNAASESRVVPIVSARLAVILLHGVAVDVITPAAGPAVRQRTLPVKTFRRCRRPGGCTRCGW